MKLIQYQSLAFVPLVNLPAFHSGSNTLIVYPRVVQYQQLAWSPIQIIASVTDAKYLTQYPVRIDGVVRNQYLYPSFVTDARSLTLKEATLISKWLGYQPSQVYGAPRNISLYPSYVSGASATTFNPAYPPNGFTGEPLTTWLVGDTTTVDVWAGAAESTAKWADEDGTNSSLDYDSATLYDTSATYDSAFTDNADKATWSQI